MVTSDHATTELARDLADPFEVVSIVSALAPSGLKGANWFRYEISQGPNRIVGFRAGSKDGVTDDVEFMVLRLNERRWHRRGRVHVVLDGKSAARSAKPV